MNFDAKHRRGFESLLERKPGKGHATWVSGNGREALRWGHDGQTYSPMTLVKRLYTDASYPVRAAPGPRYWQLPDGTSVAERAIAFEPDPL
jgi:hypothetical protein